MSSPDDNLNHATRYWPWVLVRALPAVVIAIVITFTADHSSALGFITFGAFALASGIVLVVGAARSLDSTVVRSCFIAQGAIAAVLGIVGLAFSGAGLGFLIFLLSTYGALTGFLELYSGLRGRGRILSARDWIFSGGLTVLLAVAVLLVPSGYSQSFTGPDGVERALTASIVLVGMLGAYCAILGVYLVIAGLSLKWADRTVAATAAESGN